MLHHINFTNIWRSLSFISITFVFSRKVCYILYLLRILNQICVNGWWFFSHFKGLLFQTQCNTQECFYLLLNLIKRWINYESFRFFILVPSEIFDIKFRKNKKFSNFNSLLSIGGRSKKANFFITSPLHTRL